MNESCNSTIHDQLRAGLDGIGLTNVAINPVPPAHKGVVMAFRASHPLLTSMGEELWIMRHSLRQAPTACDDFVHGIASMMSRRREIAGTEGCVGPVDDWEVPSLRLLVHPVHAYLARYDGWCKNVHDFENSHNDTNTIAGFREIDRFVVEYTSSWNEDVMEFALSVASTTGVRLQARPKHGLQAAHLAANNDITIGDVIDLPDGDRPDMRDLMATVPVKSISWETDEDEDIIEMALGHVAWVEWGVLDPLSRS